ncbi:hypothetical protein BGW80DRAFT_1378802 [Lactifluus volemus]|nr:hypothetical protein BGW80DRAFT_1378802 [Lactifluus volemus]
MLHLPVSCLLLPRIANTLYCFDFVDVLTCLASPSPYVPISLISLCYFSLYFLLPHVALHSTLVPNPSPFLTTTRVGPISFVYICNELR